MSRPDDNKQTAARANSDSSDHSFTPTGRTLFRRPLKSYNAALDSPVLGSPSPASSLQSSAPPASPANPKVNTSVFFPGHDQERDLVQELRIVNSTVENNAADQSNSLRTESDNDATNSRGKNDLVTSRATDFSDIIAEEARASSPAAAASSPVRLTSPFGHRPDSSLFLSAEVTIRKGNKLFSRKNSLISKPSEDIEGVKLKNYFNYFRETFKLLRVDSDPKFELASELNLTVNGSSYIVKEGELFDVNEEKVSDSEAISLVASVLSEKARACLDRGKNQVKTYMAILRDCEDKLPDNSKLREGEFSSPSFDQTTGGWLTYKSGMLGGLTSFQKRSADSPTSLFSRNSSNSPSQAYSTIKVNKEGEIAITILPYSSFSLEAPKLLKELLSKLESQVKSAEAEVVKQNRRSKSSTPASGLVEEGQKNSSSRPSSTRPASAAATRESPASPSNPQVIKLKLTASRGNSASPN